MQSNNLDDLFNECDSNIKYSTPESPVSIFTNKLANEIENNYLGLSTAFSEREKEKESLKEKIATAEKKLASIKNPANLAKMPFARREAMNKKLAESREEIRKEIKRYKVRLSEIEVEEGSKEGKDTNQDPHINTTNNTNDSILPHSSAWNTNPYADFV